MYERDLLDELPDGLVLVPEPAVFPVADRWAWGPKYSIQFFKVGPGQFAKADVELAPMDLPIMDILEMNSVKDLALMEDKIFLDTLVAASSAPAR